MLQWWLGLCGCGGAWGWRCGGEGVLLQWRICESCSQHLWFGPSPPAFFEMASPVGSPTAIVEGSTVPMDPTPTELAMDYVPTEAASDSDKEEEGTGAASSSKPIRKDTRTDRKRRELSV